MDRCAARKDELQGTDTACSLSDKDHEAGLLDCVLASGEAMISGIEA